MESGKTHIHHLDTQGCTLHKYSYPPTRQDWEHIRPLLTRLYQDEKKPLAIVIAEVQNQYGFRASLFKRRFAEWGIERKFKNCEVRYMLVLEHLRRSKGKGTKFFVHGRPIKSEGLRRYVRRKQLKVSEVLEDHSRGRVQPCEWVQCETPRSASPCLFATRQQRTFDGLFSAWKKLILGSLDSGLCYPGQTGLIWNYNDGHTKPDVFRAFDVFRDFLHYSRASMGNREMLLLRRGCLLMENAITCSSFLWWIGVIGVIAVLVHSSRTTLAKILVDHIDGMARAKLELSAPHNFFIRQLSEIPLAEYVALTGELFKVLIDIEYGVRSDDSSFTWQSRVDLWTFNTRNTNNGLDAVAFDLLQEGIPVYGPGPDNRMCEALIDHAFWRGLDLESWYRDECQNRNSSLLDWDNPFEDDNYVKDESQLDPFALCSLGCECFNEGNFVEARAYWERALTLPFSEDRCMCLDGSSVHYVLEYLDYLSTASDIADGNLKWRHWKADIEAAWQTELDLACNEKHFCEYS